jgi:hypothetical protein
MGAGGGIIRRARFLVGRLPPVFSALVLKIRIQQLCYRGPDGAGGFRTGHSYRVRVGADAARRYLLHPVTHEPWMAQPKASFWAHWHKEQ